MNNRSLILIGPLNNGHVACTGDTMKNQLFLKRFSEVFDKIITVDTYHWQKRPWCIFELFARLLLNPKAKIVVSANTGSANTLIKILNTIGAAKRTFYWVVGGSFHKSLENGILNPITYSKLAGIFVQGTSMVTSLQKMELHQTVYVPNSKYIQLLPQKEKFNDGKFHFVFLSRIEREKGCDYIIKAVEKLNETTYKGKFDVTFYGKTTLDHSYKEKFVRQIENNNDLIYKGVLNLQQPDNYKELARYDVMLFPTYWSGEGFPGVIIDAYIAGLPVIASDWNMNCDVVKEGETGWIIPTHNVDELVEKMKYTIDNIDIVEQYSVNCQSQAMGYDSRKVLSETNLKRWGLL